EPAHGRHHLVVARVRKPGRDRARFAVELDLTATDLGPAGVVADDGDHGNVLADHGLELEAVQPERAIPVNDDDARVGARELGSHGIARADSEGPEGARIHPDLRPLELEHVGRGRDEVSAVADDDVVLAESLPQLRAYP